MRLRGAVSAFGGLAVTGRADHQLALQSNPSEYRAGQCRQILFVICCPLQTLFLARAPSRKPPGTYLAALP